MPLQVRVYVDICSVPAGVGASGVGQSQANSPGSGQTAIGGTVPNAQTLRLQDVQAVVGADGSYTVAELLTALQAVASDIAGATGTPLVTAAVLAQINGWSTGGL